MNRRDFIGLVAGAVAWPLPVRAQQPKRVVRIGFLTTGSLASPDVTIAIDAFRKGLRDHGYVEGTDVVVELRGANGNIQRFPALATELVRLKPDVIVATN